MKYDKCIGDFNLIVNEDNSVYYFDGFDEQSYAKTHVLVQLKDEEECQLLVDEFEDQDGELAAEADSITNKYPQFHFAKP